MARWEYARFFVPPLLQAHSTSIRPRPARVTFSHQAEPWTAPIEQWEDLLRRLGDEGWDMVSAPASSVPASSEEQVGIFWFKRPAS
jgi:hypothetical protein